MSSCENIGCGIRAIARLVAAIAAIGAAAGAAAQVVTDGTVGPGRALAGPDFAIGAALGRRAGGNLFHSFARFALGAGERATFSGPADVRNVISRVTGGAPSQIDGTLRSTIPGADLYLINPAGVVFGPTATLDVTGSLHVGTADEVRFPDGARFSARAPGASALSVLPPAAFGFLGAAPAPLLVDRSTLAVPAGATLSLVGGAITLDGGNAGIAFGGRAGLVEASAGKVQLAALAGPGAVALDGARVEAARLAGIELRRQGAVSTSGDGGGTIILRAGAVRLSGSALLLNDNYGAGAPRGQTRVVAGRLVVRDHAAILSIARGAGDAAPIAVAADRITVQGSGTAAVTGIASQTAQGSSGDAGAVTVVAERLVLQGGDAQINADAFGQGNGGPILVQARRVAIRGDGRDPAAAITSSAQRIDSGSSGSIRVAADRLVLTNGGRIQAQTFGRGQGGSIELDAATIVLAGDQPGLPSAVDSSTRGAGSGGDIRVRAGTLRIAQGGLVATAVGGGRAGSIDIESGTVSLGPDTVIGSGSVAPIPALILGRGGSVRIVADRVTIAGRPPSATRPAAFGGIFTGTLGGQDAGAIEIVADELRMSQAVIVATTLADTAAGPITITVGRLRLSSAQIQSGSVAGSIGRPDAEGAGGPILITAAREAVLTDSSVITAADARGNAGDIVIASPRVSLERTSVNSTAFAAGNAGAVTLAAADRLSLDRSSVTTAADRSAGGQVMIRAGRLVDLQDSSVESSVAREAGNAGDITIDPDFLILDGSAILARAAAGVGGDIQIAAGQILRSPASRISAEAGVSGIDGTIVVEAPEVDLSGDLVILAAPSFDAAALLREPCAARRDVGASSFTGMGRGGLPASPDQPLATSHGARAGFAPARGALRPASPTLATGCPGAL